MREVRSAEAARREAEAERDEARERVRELERDVKRKKEKIDALTLDVDERDAQLDRCVFCGVERGWSG